MSRAVELARAAGLVAMAKAHEAKTKCWKGHHYAADGSDINPATGRHNCAECLKLRLLRSKPTPRPRPPKTLPCRTCSRGTVTTCHPEHDGATVPWKMPYCYLCQSEVDRLGEVIFLAKMKREKKCV